MAMLPEVRPSSAVLGETDPGLLGRVAAHRGHRRATSRRPPSARHASPRAAPRTPTAPARSRCSTRVPARSPPGMACCPPSSGSSVRTATGGYALEGSVFIAGAAVHWLRDGLRAIEQQRRRGGAGRSGGPRVRRVRGARLRGPGCAPLGPGCARPIVGPDAGLAHRGHRARHRRCHGLPGRRRARGDGQDSGDELAALRVDGGAAVNDELLQFQADLLGVPVERPAVTETTALGAAFLAGLATGFWSSTDEIAATWALERRFEPAMDAAERDRLVRRWRRGVERSRGWSLPGEGSRSGIEARALRRAAARPAASPAAGCVPSDGSTGSARRIEGCCRQHQQVGPRTDRKVALVGCQRRARSIQARRAEGALEADGLLRVERLAQTPGGTLRVSRPPRCPARDRVARPVRRCRTGAACRLDRGRPAGRPWSHAHPRPGASPPHR